MPFKSKHLTEDVERLSIKQKREEIGGAVDLSSGDLGSELKFDLDEHGNPTRVVAKKEMETLLHNKIAQFRKKMTERELEIFDLRIFSDSPVTLQEIGDRRFDHGRGEIGDKDRDNPASQPQQFAGHTAQSG